jgi:alpha-ribazole phosphatase
MKLWLVRHAAPRVEAGICYGRSDIAADALATQQAAQKLALALPADVAVTCSPLRRCTQLADAMQVLRPTQPLRIDPRLAEMDFGDWEGRRWDALGQAALDAWVAEFGTHCPGGGESVQQFMRRVAQAYDEALQAGRDAVWISHAGVIRAVRLLHAGVAEVTTANQWPATAPGFGTWELLDCQ